MRASSALALIASLVLPAFVLAKPLSKRQSTALSSLSRRQSFSDARFTWFDDTTGVGACGVQEGTYDLIVALNSDQFGSGGNCWKSITITANGNTVGAVIADECPGCPYAGLDLSVGTFQALADLGAGVLTGSWWFDGSGSAPTTTEAPPYVPPTTTQAYVPPPTTTTTSAPTTTYAPPAPTTTAAPITTHTTDATATTTTTTTTADLSPESIATPVSGYAGGNLAQLNLAFAGFGGLIFDSEALSQT